MPIHYHGRGALLNAAGSPTDAVEYAFDLHREQGPMGCLYCVNPRLPRLTTVHLRLADRLRYVVVRLVPTGFDRSRQRYTYLLFLAPDQPGDPRNVLFSANRPTLQTRSARLTHVPD